MTWKPNLESKEQMARFVDTLLATLPEHLGIDEIISGCAVTSDDTFGVGVGVLPRYITVRIAEYTQHVMYRGMPPAVAVADEVAVVHLRDGNRYEVLGASGAGASGIFDGAWIGLDGLSINLEPTLPMHIDVSSNNECAEYATIQLALNACGQDDIVLVPPGTYVEHLTWPAGIRGIKLVAWPQWGNPVSLASYAVTLMGNILGVDMDMYMTGISMFGTLDMNGVNALATLLYCNISGNVADLGVAGDLRLCNTYVSGFIDVDNYHNLCSWVGGAEIVAGITNYYGEVQWANTGGSGGLPTQPVLLSGGVWTPYATITLALAAAGACETILIPPGTYNENITLVANVCVKGLGPRDKVRITGSNAIVTTVADGWLENVTIVQTVVNAGDKAIDLAHAANVCEMRDITIISTCAVNALHCAIRDTAGGALEIDGLVIDMDSTDGYPIGIDVRNGAVVWVKNFTIDVHNTDPVDGCAGVYCSADAVVLIEGQIVTSAGDTAYDLYENGGVIEVHAVQYSLSKVFGDLTFLSGDRVPQIVPDDYFFGLGPLSAPGGRIVFDSTPAPDAIAFMDCVVGIGIATPGIGGANVKLHVHAAAGGAEAAVKAAATDGYARWMAVNDIDGHNLSVIAFGTTMAGNSLGVARADKAMFYANNMPIALGTADNFAMYLSTNNIVRTTITNGGLVGINCMPGYRLDVEDNVAGYVTKFFNDGDNVNRNGLLVQCGADNGAAVGTTYYMYALDGNGDGTGAIKTVNGVFQLADVSDERRKTKIRDTEVVGLDIINALQVRDYNWKGNPDGPVMTSFVAQEAVKVYPDMVGEDINGTLMTSRAMLIPILAKAIQELTVQLRESRGERT